MQRAVFLDRDGTVSEEVGYVNHIDRFRVFPWAPPAIRRLNDAGVQTFLITNQSGVGRGYFPEELVHRVHEKLDRELAHYGAHLNGAYHCPHHPEAALAHYRQKCCCRKPDTGMLERAASEHDLDLAASFMVGDKFQDLESGFRVKARGVLVLTGYGEGERLYRRSAWHRDPDHVAANLSEAVDWILLQIGESGLPGRP